MRRRGGFTDAPAPPLPAVVETAYPEKGRKLHREERPCNLPSCFVTWTPAARPFCADHWELLPWDARAAYESAYKRKSTDGKRLALAWMVGWLLFFYESNSTTMPPDHKERWVGNPKAFLECGCTACVRIRARAAAVATPVKERRDDEGYEHGAKREAGGGDGEHQGDGPRDGDPSRPETPR